MTVRLEGAVVGFWSDAWDGYPTAPAKPAAVVARDRGARSCVIITGDNHASYIADLKTDSWGGSTTPSAHRRRLRPCHPDRRGCMRARRKIPCRLAAGERSGVQRAQ
jgi:hypothetical protein